MKDKVIMIRVTPEDKEAIEQDARKEDRSVASFLLRCWKEWRDRLTK